MRLTSGPVVTSHQRLLFVPVAEAQRILDRVGVTRPPGGIPRAPNVPDAAVVSAIRTESVRVLTLVPGETAYVWLEVVTQWVWEPFRPPPRTESGRADPGPICPECGTSPCIGHPRG